MASRTVLGLQWKWMKMNQNDGKFGGYQDLPQISWIKNRIQAPRRFMFGLRPHRVILLRIFCIGVPPIRFKLADIPSARNLANSEPILNPNASPESPNSKRDTSLFVDVPKPRDLAVCASLQICGHFIGRKRNNWSSSGLHQHLVGGGHEVGLPQKTRNAVGNLWCLAASAVTAPAYPVGVRPSGPGHILLWSCVASPHRWQSMASFVADAFRILEKTTLRNLPQQSAINAVYIHVLCIYIYIHMW